MAYFPFYIDIEGKRILIVGGGKVALRKLEKLLPFEPEISVIAPCVCEQIKNFNVSVIEREFKDSDLDGVFCVISATDSEEVNGHIFRLCRERNILVNTVDDKKRCGFIFPALVSKNGITAGITTEGKSPVYAKYIRKQLELLLERESPNIAESLFKYRERIKAEVKYESDRKAAFEKLLRLSLLGTEINDSLVSKIIEESNSYEN